MVRARARRVGGGRRACRRTRLRPDRARGVCEGAWHRSEGADNRRVAVGARRAGAALTAAACPDETTLVGVPRGTAGASRHRRGGRSCLDLRRLPRSDRRSGAGQASRSAQTGATHAPVVLEPASPGSCRAVRRWVADVILGMVGRGGMGDVYAAYDPELDRKIALKLLNDGAADSGPQARSQGRLLKEAKAIARLSHPNVVVVHDAGTIDDRVFIAMEFVDGQTVGRVAGWPAAGMGGDSRRLPGGRPRARSRARRADRPPRLQTSERHGGGTAPCASWTSAWPATTRATMAMAP